MFPDNGVSLLASLWPQEGSKEEKSLHGKVGVPERGKPAHFKTNYQKMLTIAQVMFMVCESAAEAALEGRYSKFDALVKNFGCHITALAVQRSVKGVSDEAARVRELCQEKLKMIETMFDKPPVGDCGMTLARYCQHVGVDIRVSEAFCNLVLCRFLHIVHDKKQIGAEEVPFTCTDPLELIKNSLKACERGHIMSFATWVEGVQAKESVKAVGFMQELARGLAHERGPFLCRMMSQEFVRQAKKSAIVALPQYYSTEAALRSMQGYLVIKNKLTLAGWPIKEAKADVVFMRMPEEKMLSEAEVRRLKPHKPIVVVEGFQGPTPLAELVQRVGVIALVLSSLAQLSQYTTDYDQTWHGAEELPKVDYGFRADHMYCASVQEERP